MLSGVFDKIGDEAKRATGHVVDEAKRFEGRVVKESERSTKRITREFGRAAEYGGYLKMAAMVVAPIFPPVGTIIAVGMAAIATGSEVAGAYWAKEDAKDDLRTASREMTAESIRKGGIARTEAVEAGEVLKKRMAVSFAASIGILALYMWRKG